jgi:hypothetical protein
MLPVILIIQSYRHSEFHDGGYNLMRVMMQGQSTAMSPLEFVPEVMDTFFEKSKPTKIVEQLEIPSEQIT